MSVVETIRAEAVRLVQELETCEGVRRPRIAAELERLGQPAVGPLLSALTHPNWGVRYWTARTLATIGAPQALPALQAQEALETDPYAREAMQTAIATLGGSINDGQGRSIAVTPANRQAHRLHAPTESPMIRPLTQAPIVPPYSRQQLNWHQFSQTGSGDWIFVLKPYYAALFARRQRPIMLKSHTGWRTTRAGNNKYAYFHDLDEDDLACIQAFVAAYTRLVVLGLNDHIGPHFSTELDGCIALDFNMSRLDTGDVTRTDIGDLEYRAKYRQEADAIDALAEIMAQAVAWMPSADSAVPPARRHLTYIPPEPAKQSHLPRELAHRIASRLDASFGVPDQSPIIDAVLAGPKASLKNATFEQKLAEWQRITSAHAIILSQPFGGDAVYVIDDLYQSGATMWMYARYLKCLGARWVFGLACVKSLRDTDNI